MSAKTYAAILFVLSTAAVAGDLACPTGAVPNGIEAQGGNEAWCELAADRSLLHGPYRSWHPNGVLGVEEYYVRGRAQGAAAYRWASGARQARGSYRDGVRDGHWDFWDKTDAKAGQANYHKGVLVSGHLPKWAFDWDGLPVARRPQTGPQAEPEAESPAKAQD